MCRLFLRHGFLLACIGIALGIVLAAIVVQAMSAMLFGVAAFDPVTFACVAKASPPSQSLRRTSRRDKRRPSIR